MSNPIPENLLVAPPENFIQVTQEEFFDNVKKYNRNVHSQMTSQKYSLWKFLGGNHYTETFAFVRPGYGFPQYDKEYFINKSFKDIF